MLAQRRPLGAEGIGSPRRGRCKDRARGAGLIWAPARRGLGRGAVGGAVVAGMGLLQVNR